MMTLIKSKSWNLVSRTAGIKLSPATWDFSIKRFPYSLVRKLKSKLCVIGDLQQGIDIFENYAHIISWKTARLLLILSVFFKLSSAQVYYTAALRQAPIINDIYIALPKGLKHLKKIELPTSFKENHVIKLNWFLYGIRNSPRNFFKHLNTELEQCKFVQCPHHPCLFIGLKVICVVYVDYCLLFYPSHSNIDQPIDNIHQTGMTLNFEDDAAGFLGVNIDHAENGCVTLTQKGFIDCILIAIRLEDASPKKTLSSNSPLVDT